MVCARVMGNHVTVTVAGAQSFLQLNVFKPVIIQAVLQSCALLAGGAADFARNMVARLEPNRARIETHVANSLMLVTALNPHIGYDKGVEVGKRALARDITLKQAAVELGYVTAGDFDRWVIPADMTHPGGGA